MTDDKTMPALVSNGSEKPIESLTAEELGENDATEAPAVGRADYQPANEARGAVDEAQNSGNDNDDEEEEDDDDYNSAEDSEGTSDGGEDDEQGRSLTALLLGASGSAGADLDEGDDEDDDDEDDDFVASKPSKKPVRMASSGKRGREEGDPEPARKKTKV